jgi:hypothetical protein
MHSLTACVTQIRPDLTVCQQLLASVQTVPTQSCAHVLLYNSMCNPMLEQHFGRKCLHP